MTDFRKRRTGREGIYTRVVQDKRRLLKDQQTIAELWEQVGEDSAQPPENLQPNESGLTMEDFRHCMATGPEFGEVGYIGDYPQPLEYPCNCITCSEPWRTEAFRKWLAKHLHLDDE